MGLTMVRQMTEEYVDELIKDINWLTQLHQICINLKKGYYKDTDFLFQTDWHHTPDIYDAYNFSQIWTAILQGQIIMADIVIGEKCHMNGNGEDNNRILSKLKSPFKAKFDGSIGGNDGNFWVLEPIKMDSVRYDSVIVSEMVKGEFPLEVGYTKIETSWFHLMESHSLARWPYGSEIIRLFYKCDSELWNTGLLL